MRKATVDLLWSVPCGGVSTAIGVSHRQHNGWVPSTALACGAELGQHQRSMRDRRIGTGNSDKQAPGSGSAPRRQPLPLLCPRRQLAIEHHLNRRARRIHPQRSPRSSPATSRAPLQKPAPVARCVLILFRLTSPAFTRTRFAAGSYRAMAPEHPLSIAQTRYANTPSTAAIAPGPDYDRIHRHG